MIQNAVVLAYIIKIKLLKIITCKIPTYSIKLCIFANLIICIIEIILLYKYIIFLVILYVSICTNFFINCNKYGDVYEKNIFFIIFYIIIH